MSGPLKELAYIYVGTSNELGEDWQTLYWALQRVKHIQQRSE